MESEFNVKVCGGGVQGDFYHCHWSTAGTLFWYYKGSLFHKDTVVSSARCGITTKAGMPWWPSWMWPIMPFYELTCLHPPNLSILASPPSITLWTSPKSSCLKSQCESDLNINFFIFSNQTKHALTHVATELNDQIKFWHDNYKIKITGRPRFMLRKFCYILHCAV